MSEPSPIKSNRARSFFKTMILPMVPIMLGVYLGLLANNWNEERKLADLTANVLSKIEEDYASNRSKLAEVVPYHEALLDSTKAFLESVRPAEFGRTLLAARGQRGMNIWRGTRTGPLRDAGYQTAIVSGALAELDVDLVALISDIRTREEMYKTMSSSYLQQAISFSSDSKLVDFINFASVFSYDILGTERPLVEKYDEALEAISAWGE